MRETTRSLGAYFILSGLMSACGGMFALIGLQSGGRGDAFYFLLLTTSLLSGILGAAFVYVGACLKHLLQHKPAVPIRLTLISIVLSALRFSIFGLLINVYILYQLKRMAKETETELEEQVLR